MASGCRFDYPCPTRVTSILPVCTCSLSIPLNKRTSCSTSLELSTRKYRNWMHRWHLDVRDVDECRESMAIVNN